MDTKALRQKILDLAIHGKLVPQDPNDEPASVLLERIRAKKERLIKEGKIKKGKKSAKTSDKPHYPYELPKGWCWATLGDCIYVKSGTSINVRNNQTGCVPIYGGNGINGYCSTPNVEKTTIVIGRVGFNCGSVHFVKEKAWVTDNAFITTIIGKGYTEEFLLYLLEQLNLKKYANSTAQPVISGAKIYPITVPLPPYAEQQRIVNAIKISLSLINIVENGKEELQTSIKRAKSKVLDLAIHGKLVPQDPNDESASELLRRINPKAEIISDNGHYQNLPKGWCLVKGKYIFNQMKSCKPIGETFKYIDIDAIDNKRQIISNLKILKVANAPGRASRFTQKGDVVFSLVRPYLRNIAIVSENDCIASTGFYVCHPTEVLLPKYCYHLMISDYVINGLNEFMKGDNSPSINKGDIDNWLFPIPPLAEQKRIVSKIEEIFAQLDAIETAL